MSEDLENPTQIEEEKPNTEVQDEQKEVPPIDVEAIKQAAAREVAALYMGALGEKDRQIEEYRKQAAIPRQVVEEELDGAQFLNAPKKHIAEIVDQALQRQLAPINELWGQFSRAKQLEDVKKQFQAVPAMNAILSQYSDVVDQIIGTGPVNQQTVQMAITMIPGLIQTGQIVARGAPSNKSETISPNITPSSPTPPKKKSAAPETLMTDQEREIAKRFRMTNEEFMNYKQADSRVDTWGAKK